MKYLKWYNLLLNDITKQGIESKKKEDKKKTLKRRYVFCCGKMLRFLKTAKPTKHAPIAARPPKRYSGTMVISTWQMVTELLGL
jgi:hypothetical protein